MRIPHIILNINASNAASSSKSVPPYEVALIKQLWDKRLADVNGLEVVPYQDYRPDDAGRYHEIETVQAEEAVLRKQYGAAIFDVVYPNGLKDEITRLLVKEASDSATAQAQARIVVEAHPSLLKAGLSVEQALALQTAGYADIDALLDVEFITLAQIPTIDPATAQAIIKKASTKFDPVAKAAPTK